MQLVASYDHAAPENRYFEYHFGQLWLVFEATDGPAISYEVIYAFTEQAAGIQESAS